MTDYVKKLNELDEYFFKTMFYCIVALSLLFIKWIFIEDASVKIAFSICSWLSTFMQWYWLYRMITLK